MAANCRCPPRPKAAEHGAARLNADLMEIYLLRYYLSSTWILHLEEIFYDTKDGYGDAILSTAPNLSGNSGSPVVTLDGDVVGLTTGGVPREQSRPGERPEPSSLELHEEFDDYQYTTSDTTDVIRRYVEKFE